MLQFRLNQLNLHFASDPKRYSYLPPADRFGQGLWERIFLYRTWAFLLTRYMDGACHQRLSGGMPPFSWIKWGLRPISARSQKRFPDRAMGSIAFTMEDSINQELRRYPEKELLLRIIILSVTVKVQDIDDPILTVKKSKTSMTLPLNC